MNVLDRTTNSSVSTDVLESLAPVGDLTPVRQAGGDWFLIDYATCRTLSLSSVPEAVRAVKRFEAIEALTDACAKVRADGEFRPRLDESVVQERRAAAVEHFGLTPVRSAELFAACAGWSVSEIARGWNEWSEDRENEPLDENHIVLSNLVEG